MLHGTDSPFLANGTCAHAWGPEGHVVIAMVAEDLLPAEVRTAARKILMGAPLVTTALFADEYRVTHAVCGYRSGR